MADTPVIAFGTPQAAAQVDGAKLLVLQKALTRLSRRLLRGHPMGRALAEEIAGDAIISAFANIAGLTTARKWNPENCSMITFCIGHIRSRISNIRTSKEFLITEDIGGDIDIVRFGQIDSSDTIIESMSLRQKYIELWQSLSKMDKDVLALMLADDSNTSKTIADRLQCSLTDVENSRQRIYRNGRKIGRNSSGN